MKIAFIVEVFPSLSQTFVLNQITGLIDRGHEVDIYAEVPGDSNKTHPDVEKYQLLRRTYYQPQVPQSKIQRFITGVVLFLRSFLKDPWLVLQSVNVFKYGKHAASLRILYDVIPFLGKHADYDIIQCHFGLLGRKGMRLRQLGALQGSLITVFHGVDVSQNVTLLGQDLYNELFAAGDYFLPISYHWKRRLVALGCDEKKIAVHYMGTDYQSSDFISRHVDSDGCFRLLSIARLAEKKGLEYGIRAVASLLRQGLQIKYSIIGAGELQASLEALILQLKAEDAIKLVGPKDTTEVKATLRKSHCLLAPSVTAQDGNQEGIPVVLMEAMAMGIPVVSTYHSGIPELVEDGASGFLVPERDEQALAEKLAHMVAHPDGWADMGTAGRRKIEQQHNITQLNNRLVEIYEQLLDTDASILSTHSSSRQVGQLTPTRS
ncbi:MAG: glycosyltransferase [Cyanobacteria bacterium J06634_5]